MSKPLVSLSKRSAGEKEAGETNSNGSMVVPTGCGRKTQKKKNGTLNNARDLARRRDMSKR